MFYREIIEKRARRKMMVEHLLFLGMILTAIFIGFRIVTGWENIARRAQESVKGGN